MPKILTVNLSEKDLSSLKQRIKMSGLTYTEIVKRFKPKICYCSIVNKMNGVTPMSIDQVQEIIRIVSAEEKNQRKVISSIIDG